MPSKRQGIKPDWLMTVGIREARATAAVRCCNGDKLTGVLWGSNGGEVAATQSGLLYRILGRVLGPPVSVVKETGILGSGGLLGGCKPQKPQTRPVYTPPTVNVQADPRVGQALVGISGSLNGIDSKLDVVVANTTPILEEVPPLEADDPKANPVIAIAIALMVIGGVVFFGNFAVVAI